MELTEEQKSGIEKHRKEQKAIVEKVERDWKEKEEKELKKIIEKKTSKKTKP